MLRVIQVGVGGMGQRWTACVAESRRWEPAAYVDVDQKNLAAAATRHGMPMDRCFTDLRRALSQVEADALIDVTPQQFRRKVCLAALERGLHVLSEKPLADTLANAKAVVSAAREAGRTYMVAQNYRYQPQPETVRRFIDQGKLGDLGYVSVAFHKGPHFGGFRETMAYPLLLDMAIHHFDLLRHVLRTDVTAVQAVSVNAPWNWNAGDATAMAQLELANGVTANYAASWVAQGAETPWNGNWRFDGGKGALLWHDDAVSFSNAPGSQRAVRLLKYPRAQQAKLLDLFADAVEKGEEPETSGRNNLNSLATTFAVVKAAREHRRVRVADLLK